MLMQINGGELEGTRYFSKEQQTRMWRPHNVMGGPSSGDKVAEYRNLKDMWAKVRDKDAFLQLVDEPREDLAVPETDYTFAKVINAQAVGDFQALVQRQRRALRVSVGADAVAGLEAVVESWQPLQPVKISSGSR